MRPAPVESPLIAAVRACKEHLILAGVFSALLNLLYLAPTLYMLQVYDRVVPTRGKLTLVFLTIALVLALGSLSLLDMLRSQLLVRVSMRLDRRLTGAVVNASLASVGGKGLSKQAIRELDNFRQTVAGNGVLAVFDAPWTPIYLLVCFIIHPVLGMIAVFGAVMLLAIAARNEQVTRAPLQRANEAAKQAYISQEYSTASADVIRAMGMRDATVMRHLQERETMTLLQTKASFAGSGYVTLTRFIRLTLQSLSLGAGALLAVEGQISGGAIFAASFLISRSMAPIERVLGAWKNLALARGAYRTLTELFAEQDREPGRMHLPAPSGAVAVEHVTVFSEERDRQILADISFEAGSGEIVGIIGPSGAGKSTLARIIAGAAVPHAGVVRFDGADRNEWPPELLGQRLGFMPQAVTLFAGTVKSNIARFSDWKDGESEALDEAILEAANAAGAHEMIIRLPKGYNTVLGHGGRGLSAGQAQRIGLARAFFGSPNLLVLDEPNAHLDTEGEALLLQSLLEAKQRGATVLIIAHRSGVLAALDKLLVMRDGRLEIYGPRDSVLQRIGGPKPRSLAREASNLQPMAAERVS